MLDGVQRSKLEHPSRLPATDKRKPKFLIHPLSASRIISGIAFTGTWCAPGIREGGGAGPVAWRKRGWKFSSEARARFAAPPHRQRPPRGPRRSGKTTGGALARRHPFTLRGADPAPRFPTAPDRERSLTMARPETGRGNGEECAQCSPHGLAQQAEDYHQPSGHQPDPLPWTSMQLALPACAAWRLGS